jgi:hypothetical protein
MIATIEYVGEGAIAFRAKLDGGRRHLVVSRNAVLKRQKMGAEAIK